MFVFYTTEIQTENQTVIKKKLSQHHQNTFFYYFILFHMIFGIIFEWFTVTKLRAPAQLY